MNPKTDLVLQRRAKVPPDLIWKAWTQPEHLKHWFTPRPWTTPIVEIDLKPGGAFRTVMRGPDGQEFDNSGCYLEVIPERRLVWTTALLPGFRPSGEEAPFVFTAIVSLEADGSDGTKYTVTLMHDSEEGAKKHEEMGFQDGWGTAFEQLLEYLKAWTQGQVIDN